MKIVNRNGQPISSNKRNVTNNQLLKYYNEIQGWGGSIISVFLSTKINSWLKANGARIESIQSRILEINKEYFVHSTDQQGKIQFTYEGEGKDRKPVFKEGKTQEDLTKTITAIQNEVTVMEV